MLRLKNKGSITLSSRSEEKPIEGNTSPLHDVIKPIIFLSLFIGYSPRCLRKSGIVGGFLWVFSLFVHTALDFMSARKKYGYAWISIQFLLFLNLVMCTWSTRRKVVPWLETSVFQLDKEKRYLKTFARIRKLFRIIPSLILVFSLFGSGLQFFCFYYDDALSVSFEQSIPDGWRIVLYIIWFMTNVHLLFAFSFFWCAAACNMYTTGYSMTEYHDNMTSHLKNKQCPLTFRQAVLSFAERGTFLRKSASVCRVSLGFLVIYSIASLAVNAFSYLYKSRKAGYIFFALMPPICSVYPLCLAAWVTKQYKWYLAVVVKAWAERPDSSEEEDESGSERPPYKNKHKKSWRKLDKSVESSRKNPKPHRRSLFNRAKPVSHDTPKTKNVPLKQKKDPHRGSLFALSSSLAGSYSDTESYPKKKGKTRRGSLFVRSKASKGDSFYENCAFTYENLSKSQETLRTIFDKNSKQPDADVNSEEVTKMLNVEVKKPDGTSSDNVRPKDQGGHSDGDNQISRLPNRLKPLAKSVSLPESGGNIQQDAFDKAILPLRQNRKGNQTTTETVYPETYRQDHRTLKPPAIVETKSEDEATDDESNPKLKVDRQRVMELILRGTARAVGRLQHRAKLPKFNFEKYISYLQNVLPTIGFSIMGITVTWEMVSTLIFLEVSLLALFLQESIFGNLQAQVSL